MDGGADFKKDRCVMNLGFKTIIVATDFSPVSDLALEYARTLAHRFDAALHIVHVVEDPFPAAEVYVPEMSDFRIRFVADAEKRLASAVADPVSAPGTWEVRIGNPARMICEVAATQNADLIVMGTHGRGAFGHLFMGSVAERVVRTAPCPVLTVRDSEAAAAAAELYAAAAART